MTVDFSGIPEGATLTATVTSNPVAMPDADPPVVIAPRMSPYATVGAVKDGSVTVMLGGMDGPGRGSHVEDRPTPTSVTLGLTLTAVPPDDDEEMLLPAGPVQHHGESHLHRSNRVGLITLRMRSRIT